MECGSSASRPKIRLSSRKDCHQHEETKDDDAAETRREIEQLQQQIPIAEEAEAESRKVVEAALQEEAKLLQERNDLTCVLRRMRLKEAAARKTAEERQESNNDMLREIDDLKQRLSRAQEAEAEWSVATECSDTQLKEEVERLQQQLKAVQASEAEARQKAEALLNGGFGKDELLKQRRDQLLEQLSGAKRAEEEWRTAAEWRVAAECSDTQDTQLREEVEQLQKQLKALQASEAEAKREVQDLHAKLEQSGHAKQAMEKDLQWKCEELHRQCNSSQDQLASSQRQVKPLQKEICVVTLPHNQYTLQRRVVQASKVQAKHEVQDLHEKLKHEVQDLHEKLEQSLHAKEAMEKDLQQKCEELRRQCSLTQDQLASSQTRVKPLQNEISVVTLPYNQYTLQRRVMRIR